MALDAVYVFVNSLTCIQPLHRSNIQHLEKGLSRFIKFTVSNDASTFFVVVKSYPINKRRFSALNYANFSLPGRHEEMKYRYSFFFLTLTGSRCFPETARLTNKNVFQGFQEAMERNETPYFFFLFYLARLVCI